MAEPVRSRAELLDRLRDAVSAAPWIDAAWIGGSDAFGRADALSDIDLQVLTPVARSDEAFALVERCLGDAGGVEATLVVPEPAWHGHRQRFYRVRGLPETAMVDLCVMRADKLGPFLDPVRHGAPVVWFDRVGALVPVDDPDLAAVFSQRMAVLRARVDLLGHLPGKALARGRLVEAVDGFQRLLFAPLVEALRAVHAPRRQDYGLRYLEHDLPPDVVARLERLALPADRGALGAAIDEARSWLRELLG